MDKLQMNDKVYDVLKWIAVLLLPALGPMIEGIFAVWGIPYGTQIADTIRYLQIFLGAILGLSSIGYHVSHKNGEGNANG